jgi:hypothetical protein
VGDPSTNKTPATEPVREALAAVEAEKLEKHKPAEEAFEGALAQAKAIKRAWEKAVEKALREGHEVPPMPDAAREPATPVRPCVWIANGTSEKTVRLLADNPGGFINLCDELAVQFGSFDKYGGSGADRGLQLEFYGGRSSKLERVVYPPTSLAPLAPICRSLRNLRELMELTERPALPSANLPEGYIDARSSKYLADHSRESGSRRSR